MALGPLEILVFGFPTPSPGREVTEALATTQLAGDLRVIDVLLITKSAEGEVVAADVSDLEGIEDLAAHLVAEEMMGLLADEDVAEVAELLAPGTCAAAVLVEHTWARDLSRAVQTSGGELVAAARIPHDQVEEVEAALTAAAGSD
ncbi:MAG: hypothetical protein H0T70_02380 [Acidimicrobiia bacterium]|nr:hypothetical protein [Acidimicrobiia bacterium]